MTKVIMPRSVINEAVESLDQLDSMTLMLGNLRLDAISLSQDDLHHYSSAMSTLIRKTSNLIIDNEEESLRDD